ncbi:helix-turn-helix transcriptional regulator [Chitinimonas lacunae]|uniref:Helix-turn-helix transcriptional regulator n=1 Tax=Chitinimonas lacunae TaxID=1963018 RepID=A0ABV8MT57_9NEIS
MQRSANHDEIVALFYEGALDSAQYHNAMAALANACSSPRVAALAWNRSEEGGQVLSAVGDDSGAAADYNRYFYRLDPSRPRLGAWAPGRWYHDSQELGGTLANDPFYRDFMRPHRLGHVLAVKIDAVDGVDYYLSCVRLLDQPDFDPGTKEWLTQLFPHMQRASRLGARARALQLRAGLGWAALDSLATAVLLLEVDGRIAAANAAAERLFQQETTLHCHQQRLVPHDSGAASRLLQLLSAATAVRPRGGTLAVPGCSLRLSILPLAPESPWRTSLSQPVALVLIDDPGAAIDPDPNWLQMLYGLTPAETRLAGVLAHDHSPVECAELLGVSLATIRTQLRALFGKTGTRRQAELARLLALTQRPL